MVTEAMEYNHDVLALGFLSQYTVVFDDGTKTGYFV